MVTWTNPDPGPVSVKLKVDMGFNKFPLVCKTYVMDVVLQGLPPTFDLYCFGDGSGDQLAPTQLTNPCFGSDRVSSRQVLTACAARWERHVSWGSAHGCHWRGGIHYERWGTTARAGVWIDRSWRLCCGQDPGVPGCLSRRTLAGVHDWTNNAASSLSHLKELLPLRLMKRTTRVEVGVAKLFERHRNLLGFLPEKTK